MANELYSVLGIEASASSKEIKRAYFRQVREHPPEKESEKFKLIRSAYETLSDERARGDYDTLQKYGGEIQNLSDEAEDLMESELWDEAIKKYKRILVLAPESSAARNSLGMCYMQSEDYSAAINCFRQLIEQNPETPAYWMGLGYAYLSHAREDLQENTSAWTSALKHAQDSFAKAVDKEPENSDGYQGVAHVRRMFKDWDGAATWLENAVDADGETDLHDFDALYQLCVVYVIGEHPRKLTETLSRLIGIAPEHEDAKKYMASRLCNLGVELAEVNRYAEAGKMFRHARKLDPADADIKRAAEVATRIGKAEKEWDRLQNDSAILEVIKALAVVPLARAHGEEVSDYDFNRMTDALGTWPPARIRSSLASMKTNYPALYKMNSEIFNKLYELTEGASSSGYSGGSSCFVATAAFGSPLAPELFRLRAYRDSYLLGRAWGRAFVSCYYRVGPRAADYIRVRPRVRKVVRFFLRAVLDVLPSQYQSSL